MPKPLVAIKELRENGEDRINDVLSKWIATTIPAAKMAGNDLAVAATGLASQLGNVTTEPSADIKSAALNYRSFLIELIDDLRSVRSDITICMPEIKPEDNLGVEVQVAVIASISNLEKAIQGGGKDEVTGIAAVSFPTAYFKERATIEEKALGTGKDAEPSKSESLKIQAALFDADMISKLSASYKELAVQLPYIIACIAQNMKKLMNPRQVTGHY